MKKFMYLAVITFLATQPATKSLAYEAGPASSDSYTVQEITQALHDLDGRIVIIQFVPGYVRQQSDGTYYCNLGDDEHVAVVIIPEAIGRTWFGKNRKLSSTKNTASQIIYAVVSAGQIENKYGAKREGPVLKAIGTSIFKDIRGTVSYRW